jgi:hypothetical protein
MSQDKATATPLRAYPIRFPPDLLEYLRTEAAAVGRPLNTQVVWMLEYLRRHPVPLAPPQTYAEPDKA